MFPIHLCDKQQGPTSLHPINDSLCMSSPFVGPKDGASHMDLDVIVAHTNHDNHLGSDPVNPDFNQINNNIAEKDQEDRACQRAYNNQDDFPDKDAIEDQDVDCGDKHAVPHPSKPRTH